MTNIKKPSKGGRPTKYNKNFSMLFSILRESGATIKECGAFLGLSAAVIYKYNASNGIYRSVVIKGESLITTEERLQAMANAGCYKEEVVSLNVINYCDFDFIACWLVIFKEDRLGVIAHQKGMRNKRNRARRKNPDARIEDSIRARLWAALKGKGDGRLFSLLPFSKKELITHLKGLLETGMTMENYGDWHIDHIKPCILFNHDIPTEVEKCWSLSNLQPLWAHDNVVKGSRYE